MVIGGWDSYIGLVTGASLFHIGHPVEVNVDMV
jgi:hypothetical protein